MKQLNDTRIIGYARVSTAEQNLELQVEALKKAGCLPDDIFVEKVSARKKFRPQLERALKRLHPGDTFLVWKLDRLARSVRGLTELAERIRDSGATFKSMSEDISTAGPAQKLVFHMLAGLAEFESDVTAFRTAAGMRNLAEKGYRLGAVPKIKPAQWQEIERRLRDTDQTVKQIAVRFKISPTLIHKRFPGGKTAVQAKRKRRKT